MRRGEAVGELESGGSWECSAIMGLEELIATGRSTALTIPKMTGANEMLADVGWPITTRVVGMVLQQSWP
jgi:hypothetical protein